MPSAITGTPNLSASPTAYAGTNSQLGAAIQTIWSKEILFQAMPIPYIEPDDMANLGVFLASDESRYITGQQIRVDGGSLLKWPNGPGG